MSFSITFSEKLKKTLIKLKTKDKPTYVILEKKILQIASSDTISIKHFKNLRAPLSDYKRVHLGSCVLLFRIEGDKIIFEDFGHHDRIYKKKHN